MIILIVIGFNYLNTSPTDTKISTQKSSPKISKDEVVKETISIDHKNLHINKPSMSNTKEIDEIKLLLKKAENLLQDSKDEDALAIYNLILEKISANNDPSLNEYFVTACMSKGYIYQIYPHIDSDAAIEAYSKIIKKFEKSDNRKLIEYYIDAKIQLSYLLPEDEKIESYNELISKFENSTDINIQKKIESLLITKSFQLMGKNDEEAMQILDKVIEKYQEKNATITLPENIQFSILNNIELALITNNENDDYVELAKKFMSNSPDTKPLLDMLEIIKNSQDIDQEEALARWKEEHGDYRFPDWSFQEVERWAYQIEDQETKDRVSKYINAFVNQKYNIPDKYSESTTYEEMPIHNNSTQAYDTISATNNQNNEIYRPMENNNDEEIIEDEITAEEIYENEINQAETNESTEEEIYPDPYENPDIVPYEPDPYVQEVYEATGEYPDPYE